MLAAFSHSFTIFCLYMIKFSHKILVSNCVDVLLYNIAVYICIDFCRCHTLFMKKKIIPRFSRTTFYMWICACIHTYFSCPEKKDTEIEYNDDATAMPFSLHVGNSFFFYFILFLKVFLAKISINVDMP